MTTAAPAVNDFSILVVDDDPLIRDLLRSYIEDIGCPCATAADGAAAVEMLRARSFNLVVTDMTMPGMDGMELIRYIKEHHPRTDVIAVTGYTETYTYTEVIRAGASDFLSKPFNLDEFTAKLNRVMREQALVRKLEHLSMCDGLTQLFNRRHFEIKISEEAPKAHRQGHPLFLAIIDIDHFKEYNDIEGHQAGDRLLALVGKTLVLCTRENVDWCFRYGGDEFAVLIPYAGETQAVKVAQRILAHYRGSDTGGTSLSIGLARFIRHPGESWQEDIMDLIRRADQAMYQAKNEGGDRLHLAGQTP